MVHHGVAILNVIYQPGLAKDWLIAQCLADTLRKRRTNRYTPTRQVVS